MPVGIVPPGSERRLERLPDADAAMVLAGLGGAATEVIVVEAVLDPAVDDET